jgi:DNA-binding response OmpR family regulator
MRNKRVLIIEDHSDCRELLAIVLGRSGYVIFKAATGLEGVDLARTTSPDLIVTDFGLPDLLGDQLILRLKADPSTEKIPVILTTGYIDTRVSKRAIAAGAAKVLVKPFELDELMDEIQQCLSSETGSTPMPQEPAIVIDQPTT